MDPRVLVAYATRHGSTAEIAERIGQHLRQAGLSVDVQPVGQVDDLAPYRAVVLSSGVYIGRWHRAATRFLKTHQEKLANRPVRLFSSGPTGEGDPVELTDDWRPKVTPYPHPLLQQEGDLNLCRELMFYQLWCRLGEDGKIATAQASPSLRRGI